MKVFDLGRLNRVANPVLRADQQVVNRWNIVCCGAETGGECALWVKIDHENLATVFDECAGERNRRRRFADTTLLVAQRDDARGAVARQRCRHGKVGHGLILTCGA